MSTHADASISQISLLMDMEAMLSLLQSLQLDADMDILTTVVLRKGHVALDLGTIRLHGSDQIGYGLNRHITLQSEHITILIIMLWVFQLSENSPSVQQSRLWRKLPG